MTHTPANPFRRYDESIRFWMPLMASLGTSLIAPQGQYSSLCFLMDALGMNCRDPHSQRA